MPSIKQAYSTFRRMYRRVFEQALDSELRKVQVTLQHVSMFKELSRNVLTDLSESVHQRTYQRDEYIYYEDDPGLGMYIVQRGRVRLLAEDESGTVHELRQASEFEVIGDLAILGDYRRVETAQAATEVQVLGFFRPDLKTLRKRSPRAGAEITNAIARHLAARQMELVRVYGEQEGKIAALRLIESASLRTNGAVSNLSVPLEERRPPGHL